MPDPIAWQLGLGVTDFEMILTGLGLPAPSGAEWCQAARTQIGGLQVTKRVAHDAALMIAAANRRLCWRLSAAA